MVGIKNQSLFLPEIQHGRRLLCSVFKVGFMLPQNCVLYCTCGIVKSNLEVKESRPCQHASWLRFNREEAANTSIVLSFCYRMIWVMDSIPWVRCASGNVLFVCVFYQINDQWIVTGGRRLDCEHWAAKQNVVCSISSCTLKLYSAWKGERGTRSWATKILTEKQDLWDITLSRWISSERHQRSRRRRWVALGLCASVLAPSSPDNWVVAMKCQKFLRKWASPLLQNCCAVIGQQF